MLSIYKHGIIAELLHKTLLKTKCILNVIDAMPGLREILYNYAIAIIINTIICFIYNVTINSRTCVL